MSVESASRSIELTLRRQGASIELLSAEVGLFTRAHPTGEGLAPGQDAGTLIALGRSFTLVVPDGASGVITSHAPERAHAAVGIGDVLYVLSPSAGGAPTSRAKLKAENDGRASSDLVLRSPQPGRFYHRPSPTDPPFVKVGQTIEDGAPVGMIEVMKTFSHVPYRASAGLPRRAKILRLIAADGADVKSGDPLLEVEPA